MSGCTERVLTMIMMARRFLHWLFWFAFSFGFRCEEVVALGIGIGLCLTFVYSYTSRYPTLANAQGCSMPHGRAYMFIDLRLQFWIQKQKFICLFQTSRVYVCCLVTELCVITTKPVSGYQKPPHENISNASVCMLAPKTVDPFRVTC
jgi:hypothetical protein